MGTICHVGTLAKISGKVWLGILFLKDWEWEEARSTGGSYHNEVGEDLLVEKNVAATPRPMVTVLGSRATPILSGSCYIFLSGFGFWARTGVVTVVVRDLSFNRGIDRCRRHLDKGCLVWVGERRTEWLLPRHQMKNRYLVHPVLDI